MRKNFYAKRGSPTFFVIDGPLLHLHIETEVKLQRPISFTYCRTALIF